MGKLVTGKVRFSYVNVFEPKTTPNGDLRYSITMLISKNDNDTYQRIMAEINKTLQENVANIFKGVMPANPKMPIYDGDGLRPSGEPFGAECKNCWVISANSKNAPQVVDTSVPEPLPIMSKEEFYSGCYGRASLWFGAYNSNGSKGVCCKLNAIQKLEDGERLDGRTSAKEDFGTPYQPQMPVTPLYNQPAVVDPITGQPLITGQANSSVYGGV